MYGVGHFGFPSVTKHPQQRGFFLGFSSFHLVYIPFSVLQYKCREEEGKTSPLPAKPTGSACTPTEGQHHVHLLTPTPKRTCG